MAQVNSENSTAMPVDQTRRRFLSQAASVAAGGAVLALATIPTASAAAAPASAPDASKASPALRAAARALDEAHERLKAAKARFVADDLKVAEWSRNNPEPLNGRARKRWVRKWREYRDATEYESWQAQLDAEKNFRDAQMAVAKIKPRDMDELTLKACLSGFYDRVQLAGGAQAIIGYSVALDLVSLTNPVQSWRFTKLHPCTVASSDRLLSNAYSDLEGEVDDLARMARLAEIQVNKAVGQLSCKDEKYIEAPDYEAADLAIFAVSEMAKMAERFKEIYYKAFTTKP
jgi:hypothetical protein